MRRATPESRMSIEIQSGTRLKRRAPANADISGAVHEERTAAALEWRISISGSARDVSSEPASSVASQSE